MSHGEPQRDGPSLDSDVGSDSGNYTQTYVSEDAPLLEQSPLLPNDLPADIVPPKSFRFRVLLMCIVFLFIVEVSQFIMEPPLQKIMEDIICRKYYPDHLLREPSILDRRCKNDQVQQTLAMVRGWSLSFEMATPILAQFPFGIIADKYGRRPVLFLSVFGCLLQTTWVMVVLYFPDVFSIWAMLPGSLFYLVGGGGPMAAAMVWTIVADVVPVAERTSVFYQITAAVLVINVIANPISAWLLKFDPWIPMWLSFGFLIAGTGCTLLIPETLGLRRKADDRRQHLTNADDPSHEDPDSLKHHVLKQAWFTVKNDMGHVWRFIFASKSIMLLLLAISAHMPIRLGFYSILLQYISKRFDWDWSTATYVLTVGIIATVVALLVVLPLASTLIDKRYGYSPVRRDLLLSRVSVLFLAIGVVFMACAGRPWLFVASLVVGSMGNAFNTLCRALLNAVVEPHTVATLNTTISLVELLMAVISGPAMGWLFSKGMHLGGAWQGLPFLVMTLLTIVISVAMFAFRIPTGVAQAHEG
ncbi:hypothetical protein AK830_g12649 [Neonectria ditissima]|uniref:Major facilitator superfamily (MFS) profile domain-containing protein n=1 Tax=Neonectria ditissima TaxID=78410 RepID=A0A0P7B513_9HYPO|nr:hypothetical protein AK830_g12649 [Neonectria ditissima]